MTAPDERGADIYPPPSLCPSAAAWLPPLSFLVPGLKLAKPVPAAGYTGTRRGARSIVRGAFASNAAAEGLWDANAALGDLAAATALPAGSTLRLMPLQTLCGRSWPRWRDRTAFFRGCGTIRPSSCDCLDLSRLRGVRHVTILLDTGDALLHLRAPYRGALPATLGSAWPALGGDPRRRQRRGSGRLC